MKDIVRLYEQPYDERLPVVCFDEKLVELRQSTRPGYWHQGLCYRDHEYIRRGTANLFMMTEPKGGRHWVRVTRRRTARDFAETLQILANRYPRAITVHLVMDNLNTHSEASLIQAFGRRAGRRLWSRFTVHYTPKHGSWLNQAEIALSVTARACLHRRMLASIVELRRSVTTYWAKRRRERWKINWRWTVRHADLWFKANESRH